MDIITNDSMLSIHEAAEQGKYDRVKAYLDQNIELANSRNAHGNTPLHQAAVKGHDKVVKLLLQRGADFRLKNKARNTPLYYAIFMSESATNYIEVVKLLLEHGDDPSQRVESKTRGRNGHLIELALNNCDAEKLRLLIRYNQDPHNLHSVLREACSNLIKSIQRHYFLEGQHDSGNVYFYNTIATDFRGEPWSLEYKQLIHCLEILILAGAPVDTAYLSYPLAEQFHQQWKNKDLSESVYLLNTVKDVLHSLTSEAETLDIKHILIYPQLQPIIAETLALKQSVGKRLGYLGTRFIQHVLCLPKEEIVAFLKEENVIFWARQHLSKNDEQIMPPKIINPIQAMPQEIINSMLEARVGFFRPKMNNPKPLTKSHEDTNNPDISLLQ